MNQAKGNMNKQISKKLDRIVRQLDTLIVVLLAKSAFERKDIAKILGVTERTVSNIISVRKLKKEKSDVK